MSTRPLLAALLVTSLISTADVRGQIPLGGTGLVGRGNTIPSVAYFRAIDELYKGDYRDAERTFQREIRSAIKIGITERWLDSIAYHALLGEVYYHQGRLGEALTQFDRACLHVLAEPQLDDSRSVSA